ncbi:DUF2141 domain-containing protein [Flagellimonas pacifica]|uniref:Uncharacterized conserved protein, DUF2141 family n=1 Tax=Flagellimonas pacifica TaxID=1247520 RepID=A0A285MFJ9_9FLAO|nr:DUF2141 domain-containing protein [Allomuricauda parva]SNY95247.1 Uncharacterized conserved protein, DUF2141 family [Allomuricauda parva]
MRTLAFCTFIVPVWLFSQNTISVKVHNVPSQEGKINVAVYDSDKTFLKFEGVVKTSSAEAEKGMVTLRIENIPAGEYALAVFHDENANDKLDTNWLGIPKEKVAFSKAKMHTFGPPKYKECVFSIDSDYEISIEL